MIRRKKRRDCIGAKTKYDPLMDHFKLLLLLRLDRLFIYVSSGGEHGFGHDKNFIAGLEI